jgi:MoaD family protein
VAITVKVPTIFRAEVGGHPVVEGTGRTLRDLLEDLDLRYPGFKSRIIDGEGGLHRFVNLYVNDEDVRYLASLDTAVAEGDTVSILPAVAGGARPGYGVNTR